MNEKRFKTIGLIGKYADPSVADTLQALRRYLTRHGCTVLLDVETAEHLQQHDFDTASRDELGARCDLAMIVGGDGTLLNAARSLCDHGVPLLGINLGRLGFLADVSPHEMESRLDAILSGEYLAEQRLMLQARICRDGAEINTSEALNDVVIHKWDVARMIELETYIDGLYVNTHRSDGLIVSTPTGSTAYALSGGGPIIHPALAVIEIVPICPHTLSMRPLLVNADSRIEILVTGHAQSKAQVTCDGQINLGLVSGDRIVITPKAKRLTLIHPSDHDYYDILREKLGWGGRPAC